MAPSPPPNPFSPPRAELDGKPSASDAASAVLASRWQRLGGALFDGFLFWFAYLPVYFGSSFAEVTAKSGNLFRVYTSSGRWGLVAGMATISLSVLQWHFITTRGQTLGKMMARTRIVRTDGSPAGFVRGVVLRHWVFSLPSYALPLVGLPLEGVVGYALFAISFIDVLLVFRRSQRCGHDLLADTKVIEHRKLLDFG